MLIVTINPSPQNKLSNKDALPSIKHEDNDEEDEEENESDEDDDEEEDDDEDEATDLVGLFVHSVFSCLWKLFYWCPS